MPCPTSFTVITRRLVVPAVAAALLAAGCGSGAELRPPAAPSSADDAPETMMASPAEEPNSTMVPADEPSTMTADGSTPPTTSMPAADPALLVARERCLAAPPYLEALHDEGAEDEPEELSEGELERTMAPEFPTVDGVAAPEDRPVLEAMPGYDPASATFDQLDHLVAFCIESDIVSEAELFGDDGDDGWCEELAGLDAEEVREFAVEDGEDLVREEFAACDLPDPLVS